MKTAVLLLIFNRPDTTVTVFEKIKAQKPERLYIAADGPRANVPGEAKKCDDVKNVVLNGIDWDCKVKTLFRDNNMGCGKAVSQAITWFFEHEEDGIILEDDCVANESFFELCENLLEYYRNEEQIMMVSGTSYQPAPLTSDTYYFSKYAHIWGWATWKRAWKHYDFKLSDFNEEQCLRMLKGIFKTDRERELWLNSFRHILNGFDTWDYQWMYSIWNNNGSCVIPWKNVISNIGFGVEATHTRSEGSAMANLPQFEIANIKHPKKIKVNAGADRYERYHFLVCTPTVHLGRAIKRNAKKIITLFKGHSV